MSYIMTQAEDEMWARWCGLGSYPSEFAEDDPETIDAVLREVIASHGDAHPDDADEVFAALRGIVRKAVGR